MKPRKTSKSPKKQSKKTLKTCNVKNSTTSVSKYFMKPVDPQESHLDLNQTIYKTGTSPDKAPEFCNDDSDFNGSTSGINATSKLHTNFKSRPNFKRLKPGNHLKKIMKSQLTSGMNEEHLELALAQSDSITFGPQKNASLESFGFKISYTNHNSSPISNPAGSENIKLKRRKKTMFQHVTPTLLMRTNEDRQQMIQDKINMILNEKNNIINTPKNKLINCNKPFSLKLEKYNLGTNLVFEKSSLVSTDLGAYYVDNLPLDHITDLLKNRLLLKNWHKIVGREKTPKKNHRELLIGDNSKKKETESLVRAMSPDLFDSDDSCDNAVKEVIENDGKYRKNNEDPNKKEICQLNSSLQVSPDCNEPFEKEKSINIGDLQHEETEQFDYEINENPTTECNKSVINQANLSLYKFDSDDSCDDAVKEALDTDREYKKNNEDLSQEEICKLNNSLQVSPDSNEPFEKEKSINIGDLLHEQLHEETDQFDLKIIQNPTTEFNKSMITQENLNLHEPNENVLQSQIHEVEGVNISKEVGDMTPQSEIKVKTKDITPMEKYDNKGTPEINNELKKYGLRNLKRHRGVQMLEYIYNCMHPKLEVCENEQNSQEKIENLVKRKKLEFRNCSIQPNAQLSQCGASQSENSKRNILNNIENEQENCDLNNFVGPKTFSQIFREKWDNFLTTNPDIRNSILMYKPIPINSIMKSLKEQGCECNLKDVTTFLDSKSITVSNQQAKEKRK